MHISRTDNQASFAPPAAGHTFGGRLKIWLGQTDRQIMLATLLIATLGFVATEKIGMNGGLGWDGAIYAGYVRDFPGAVVEGIDSYRIQRVLPGAIAHYVLAAIHPVIKDRHIINAFGVINILCTTLVAWLWCRIARELKIGDTGKWLGFAGLILNFGMTKNAFFNPVLTDVPAMAIATGMFYCYLRNWRYWLLGTTLLGAFTWPTLIYVGAALAMFPRRPEQDAKIEPAPRQMHWLLAGLVTYYAGLWIVYSLRATNGPALGFLYTIEAVLPLSIAVFLAYLCLGLAPLLNNARLYRPWTYFQRSDLLVFAALVAMLAGIKGIQALGSVRPGYMTLQTYLLLMGLEPVAKPGVSFLMAVTFFGPMVLLAAFVWNRVAGLVHQHGLGLTLVVMLGVVHGLDSESRHFNYLIPMVFPFVVKAIEGLCWRRAQYALFGTLAVLSTKVWLVIKGTFADNVFQYPDQLYSMHHGPFLGNEMYLAHLAATAIAALLLYFVCFYRPQATGVSPAITAAPHFALSAAPSMARNNRSG